MSLFRNHLYFCSLATNNLERQLRSDSAYNSFRKCKMQRNPKKHKTCPLKTRRTGKDLKTRGDGKVFVFMDWKMDG